MRAARETLLRSNRSGVVGPQTGGGGAPARNRDKSIRYRKGGARGTQPRMQGGARPEQRNPIVNAVGKPTYLEKDAQR